MNLPGLAPIVRLFDVHRGGSERLEGDDQMSHVKLGLKIELNRGIFLAVLGLPPGAVLLGLFLIRRLHSIHDILDSMRGARIGFGALVRGVAPEAFLVFFGVVQMGEDAVTLLPLETAGGGGRELLLPADEQVSGGWVARALIAASTDGGVSR